MTVTNHVFVDFQNMKSVDPNLFQLDRLTSITLLLGRQNHSLDVLAVKELMRTAVTVEMIRIEKDGKDAVDFTLAYYLGRKAITNPGAFFHIVSKDKGFDPMIEHLNAVRVKAARHDTYPALTTALKPKGPASAAKKPTVAVQKQSA